MYSSRRPTSFAIAAFSGPDAVAFNELRPPSLVKATVGMREEEDPPGVVAADLESVLLSKDDANSS
jgi:hypothetical protein